MNVNRIIEAAKASTTNRETLNRLEDMRWAPGYAEPGYSEPKRGGVWFANWNDIASYDPKSNTYEVHDGTMGRLASALERYGASIEWEDEWSTCDQCGKAVRTSPDSYSWQPSYFMGDCEIICHECIAEDPEMYLEEFEGKGETAWTLDIDPADHGYTLLEGGFENGMHPGQNDSPEEIADRLRARGITRFLFRLDSVGQFDARFSVYVKAQDNDDDAEGDDE